MPENGHKQAEPGKRDPGPTTAAATGKGRDSKRAGSGKKNDDLASYEKTRKALFNKLWQAVPRRLRIPLVALILIGGGLVASQSVWYPTVQSWINPPPQRIALGGRVLNEMNQGFPNAEVQLLDDKQETVSAATTDGSGVVTFNISTEDQITTLRCADKSGTWTSLPFDADVAIKSKSFQVFLDQKRIEYHD